MELLREKAALEKTISAFKLLESSIRDDAELLEISEDEPDLIVQISKNSITLERKLEKMKVEAMFSSETDSCDAFVEINSGAGGTESQDWAEMLERMYVRWGEIHEFKTEVLHRIDGEEAGIKQSIVRISGENVFGWLKFETGVHRLVRVSPFNAQGKRQTSFASLLVLPVIESSTTIQINPSDLKIDTYRSSGAGGQHVNTTDSAIRVTHLPTGIVVTCQNNRSQHRNKEEAMKVLLSRLYELEERKKRDQKDSVEKDDISWGNQIRNYVLHPYKLVKDTRTDKESQHPDKILNGEIDEFLLECILKLSKKIDQ